MQPEKITKATKGRPRFQKGTSGNPRGRTPGSRNRPRHLPITQAITAVTLAKQGYTVQTITRMLKARPEAVKEALGEARRILEALAPEAAIDWAMASRIAAAEGDHKPAMALLQSVKVVEPVAQTYDTGNGPGAKAVAAVKVELHGFHFAGLPTPAPEPVEPKTKTIDVTASTP